MKAGSLRVAIVFVMILVIVVGVPVIFLLVFFLVWLLSTEEIGERF
jgi:hypothetical protein